jgi:hypothetical protein
VGGRKRQDLTGKRFGKLVVVRAINGHLNIENMRWLCMCDCGRTREIRTDKLRKGGGENCWHGRPQEKHGHRHGRTYKTWQMMKQRCTNPNHKSYYRYGGRGITICSKWIDSFCAFLEDMGERPPNTSISRIDGDKGYSPDNCEWQTSSQQAKEREHRKWTKKQNSNE